MAILTEDGNEYEVQIVNAVTGQSFKEYVKLGDQKIHGDREAERYITAHPGIMFKIQITLKTGFCFKPFDAVEANLYFKGQSTYYGLAVVNDPNPGRACSKQDPRMEIACVNMSNYGKNVIGAPFVFKKFKIDERLSGQTDIIGVNSVDLGSFHVTLNRRRIAATPNNYLSRDTTTALWNAEKVDTSSFEEQRITNSIGLGQNRISTKESVVSSYKFYTSDLLKFNFIYRFLNRLDVVPYPPPLYYNPWKSLTDIERRCTLRELQNLCRSRREWSLNFTPERCESGKFRSWNDMQPSEREIVFWILQKEQKEFSAYPREVGKIKREAQGPPNAVKQEIELSNKFLTRNFKPKIIPNHRINEEHSDLDYADLPSKEPLAKRQKIIQEPIDVDMIQNSKIRQEPTDFGAFDEKAMVLKKETAIKYDLTELIDAIVLLEPSTPSTNPEDSVYWEMTEEVLRQTADEFVRIRG
ncbi:uncharacterized protein Bfra_007606 [Botrytis fragariae]|uniref:DUF7918 domain-containing protein n=1 Tax=Botrytis fragariae TaxID=1964551 RepID=A0A8H6APF2_9HELO|nr:uncharacterized protein Bfra_007606 [Botrytis fragariae]KAF5871093.1 hypothetical protein Bfra_007606 [Botrytis fragariae]